MEEITTWTAPYNELAKAIYPQHRLLRRRCNKVQLFFLLPVAVDDGEAAFRVKLCKNNTGRKGRWEMGDGRWEVGDGRWEMGDGIWGGWTTDGRGNTWRGNMLLYNGATGGACWKHGDNGD